MPGRSPSDAPPSRRRGIYTEAPNPNAGHKEEVTLHPAHQADTQTSTRDR